MDGTPDIVTTLALFPAVSRTVHALIVLDVPDLLAGGPATIPALAERTGTRPRRLRQLLRTAATTGLFRTLPGDVYELTDAGTSLLRDHPSSARDLVLTHVSPAYQRSYDALVEAARTGGRPAFEIANGRTVFEHYERNDDEYASFSRMMAAYLGDTPRAVAAACDFAGGGHVVDVGGGVGTQLVAVLEQHPHLTGTLFDTPQVIRQAAGTNPPETLRSRWSAEAGDFFVSVPGGGDFYVLSHIVHDWDDAEATTILRTCAMAAPPGARFLLVEEVNPDGDEPHRVKMLDVALFSVMAGGERSVDELDALFDAAGLRRTRVLPTGSTVSVVEAVHAG